MASHKIFLYQIEFLSKFSLHKNVFSRSRTKVVPRYVVYMLKLVGVGISVKRIAFIGTYITYIMYSIYLRKLYVSMIVIYDGVTYIHTQKASTCLMENI